LHTEEIEYTAGHLFHISLRRNHTSKVHKSFFQFNYSVSMYTFCHSLVQWFTTGVPCHPSMAFVCLGCHELICFSIYHWKDVFKMLPNLKPNCYRFATRCHKLYLSFAKCGKPKKVGSHWFSGCCICVQLNRQCY